MKMTPKTARHLDPTRWEKYVPFRNEREHSLLTEFEEAKVQAKIIAGGLRSRFGAARVLLFGSLARGDFRVASDIDLAVAGVSPGIFYRAVAYATGISKKWKVDVVDLEDCPIALLEVILKEGIEL